MSRFLAAALLGLLVPAALPGTAMAQTAVGCAPFCDFRHYYGAQDYTYVRPGTYCYPVCAPDGTCAPVKTCVRTAPWVATPATVTFYDPSIATPGVVVRRAARAPVVRVRPYRPRY
jgi:hypothetical protein